MVDPAGFEPATSALQGQRSPSLSYGPARAQRPYTTDQPSLAHH